MFSDVRAAKMVDNNRLTRTLAGSEHRLMLRRFKKPIIDSDYKEATNTDQRPVVEQTILAKVRALSENEMVSTEVGMIKRGDLFIMVDPDLIVTNLDEVRFMVDTQLEDLSISMTWDYTIFEVMRTDFSDLAVGRSFIARRKMQQTEGGSQLP